MVRFYNMHFFVKTRASIVNGFKKLGITKLRAYTRIYIILALEKLFVVLQWTNCSIDLIVIYEKHKSLFPSMCQHFYDFLIVVTYPIP